MRLENLTMICGKDRFSLVVQIESKDLRPLQNQAYKDALSVQELVKRWITDSLNDLIVFSKGS